MDLRKIRTLLQLMNENQLAEMELEEEGMKIKFSKFGSQPVSFSPQPNVPLVELPQENLAPSKEAPASSEGYVITSPMPGTYYEASSPDQPPFVKVGDVVDAETVVCIIEAMKVMNEIKAECQGEIAEIYLSNGEPVEFGKPLFRIV